jgi:twitching motility two-component system response regulator PilG
MTIQGNLGTIGQGEENVLRSINRDRRTGRLSIFYENEQRRNVQDVIFIDNGMVIGLKSLDKFGVKELLVYAGKLTKEQVADAVEKAKASGDPQKTAEAVLMEDGVINRDMVVQSIATLIRGCVQRILTKPYGLYIFHPSDQLKGVKPMTRISILQIILDYCRALKSDEVVNSLVPALDYVPKLAVNIEEIKKRFHLTDDEWRFLFLIDGEKPLKALLSEGVAEDALRRHVYMAQMCSFIRLMSPEAKEASQQPSAAPSPMMGGSVSAPPVSASSAANTAPAYAPAPAPAPQPMAPPPMAPPVGMGSSAASGRNGAAADTDKQIILVVDDSKTIQKMVEIALKDCPYKLVMADDGFQAIELAQSLDPQPDLVILDVIMPRLDGYKTCGQLRKIFAPRKVPVIMLTARDGTFDKIKGKLAGASMYMAKPFEPSELQDAVAKHLAAGTSA